jgi:hypothetical protein
MEQAEVFRIVTEIVLGMIGFFAVTTLNGIKKSIDETRHSVDELNVKFAKIVEKSEWHEKHLSDFEDRLMVVEKATERQQEFNKRFCV